MMCLQCDHAACVQFCPVGALALSRQSAVVLLDQKLCIRCHACVVACPFGNMHLDGLQRLPLKCDLCGEPPDPACVKWCTSGALTVVEVEGDSEE